MMRWLWLLQVLTIACLASTPARVLSQAAFLDRDKSAILDKLPLPPANTNLEDLFSGTAKLPPNMDVARLFKDTNLKPEDIEKLLSDPSWRKRIAELNPDTPGLPESVRKMLKSTRTNASKVSDEQLKELLKTMQKGKQADPPQPGRGLVLSRPSEDPIPGARQPALGGADRGVTPPGQIPDGEGRVTLPNAAAARSNSSLSKGLLNFAKGIQKLDPSLADSPALKQAIRDLSRHIGEDDPRWEKLSQGASTIKEKWSSLSGALHLERLAPKDGLHWPPSLTPPALPHWNRNREGTEVGSGNSLADRSGAASSESGFQGWHGLLAGIVLGAIGVLAWSILRSPKLPDERAAMKSGQWPVEPKSVTTRAELIQAFEYLSLRSLGWAARNWNHETIAEQLGAERKAGDSGSPPIMTWDPLARRRAAAELAALYEQARYAPASENLPDNALAAARRDLCFLAGMPAS